MAAAEKRGDVTGVAARVMSPLDLARVLRESVGPSECGDRLAQWSVLARWWHGLRPAGGSRAVWRACCVSRRTV